ncbi:MAG: cytochrome P450 family protein [Acidimicrobiales bacterium]
MDAPAGLYWDPFDVDIDRSPYAVWKRLRDQAPVYRNERFDFWGLSRFEDVAVASRDPQTFLSGHGTVLELMGAERRRPGLIIFMDPPEHPALRALVSRAFTPRRTAELEEQIRAICSDLLDAQAGARGFDYVADFGAQLPSRVISALLGAPESDRPEVLALIDRVFHIEPGVGMVNDVSLGAGIYFCLGAALARLEGRVALEETLARFPTWEVDRARTERLHTSTVRGHRKVPILVG